MRSNDKLIKQVLLSLAVMMHKLVCTTSFIKEERDYCINEVKALLEAINKIK